MSEEDPALPLTLAHEAIGLITWTWDLASDETRWYGDPSPLLGLPAGGCERNAAHYLRLLHPDDRAAARELFIDCMRGQRPSYRSEERVVWPDGSLHWLETYGRGIRGSDGRTERMVGVVHDISERKQAEAVVQHSQAQLRQLIDEAPMAIGMSRGDTISDGNPRFFELFGASAPAQLIGQPVDSLVAPASLVDFSARSKRRALGLPAETSYDIVARRLDGSEFACQVSLARMAARDDGETLVFMQDISERQRAAAALQRERDRANRYLQMAECILVAFDDQARVTLLNRKGYQVLGYAEGELQGEDWFRRCLPKHEYEATLHVYRELMAGRSQPYEYHENDVLTKTGAQRRIGWRNTLLRDDSGRVVGTLSAGEDITERRRAEVALQALNASLEQRVAARTAELEASNAALAEARDAAESATRAKGHSLANMSHEIRTPMNAILGMTDLALRSTELQPKLRSYLGNIRRAADSLLVLINDILDFSKIESGKLLLERREFVLAEVLDKVTTLVGLEASRKGLDLLLDCPPELPPRLLGDPLRVGQVLLNLCSNAVKFTAAGEIEICVRGQPVAPGRVRLRCSVRDTGIGMRADQLAQLYRPFDQLDASTTRQYGGTGLGLAISKQLVELMGGQIGVESEAGRGSNFHFTLDLDLPAAAEAAAVPAPAALPALPALHGRRVLVVDDSAAARALLQRQLLALGCVPLLAASAAEALPLLAPAGPAQTPELLLLDWRLQGGDGLALARRLRAAAPPQLPCLLVTAYGDETIVARAQAEGISGCVAQPVTVAAMAAALTAAFGNAAAAAWPLLPAPALADPIECLAGCRILLVEDNELNQIVATDLLTSVAGARVQVAANGQAALDSLARAEFDLLLMDVQMPVMDGYETTARIRGGAHQAAVPVIAMTAHAMARDRERCLAAGMNDFVSKPFEPRELFAVLARWLGAPAAGDAAAAAASAAPAAAGSGTAAAPAVSFARGLHRCLGRRDLHLRVLRRFMQTQAQEMAQFGAAVAAADRATLVQLAHMMVSTAGTIGAEELSSTARALQQSAEGGDGATWRPLAVDYQRLHRQAVAEVAAYLLGQAETQAA